MKRTGIIVVLACAAVLLGGWMWQSGSLASLTTSGNPASKPKAGYEAPAFTLPGLDERPYSVGGPREKPVLINFWASWCGPCDIEAPDLQALYEKYGDRIDFYGINATSYDRERDARKFVDEKKLTFPIPMDREGEVAKLYKVNNFPTSLLIGPDGKVLERIPGVIPREEWEKKLSDLVAGGGGS
ncbi:TlpA family protein disulfide reductase [Paenibacillus sp. D51F]